MSIATEFMSRMFDLSAWSMTRDFFERFPELYEDIPASQTIPKALQLWGIAGVRELSDVRGSSASERSHVPEAMAGLCMEDISTIETMSSASGLMNAI